MSGSIKSIGFSETPLYGTRKATFVLDGMDDYGKKNNVAEFLWGGLETASKSVNGTIYECLNKGFYRGNASENGRIINNRRAINHKNILYSEIGFGDDVFLVSEFLDTKRGLEINGLNVEYTQVFRVAPIVAGIMRSSEKESALVINPWDEGIGFDPSFLYHAGEKFGKLVRSK